jgi:thioesterase domain-containing protein
LIVEDYSLTELEEFVSAQIPLAVALGIKVSSASFDSVTLWAPLASNVNHHGTVFGGSASATSMLAAWLLMYIRLQSKGPVPTIVIQRNEMRYLTPIRHDFEVRAVLAAGEDWDRFLQTLQRRQKARIDVNAELISEKGLVGKFSGTFVAILA